MGHWARARAQPQKARWPPMALSHVLWACPMPYGPVLCPMALSNVPWPCPMSQWVRHVALCTGGVLWQVGDVSILQRLPPSGNRSVQLLFGASSWQG